MTSTKHRLGIIGVGHLIKHLVPGLLLTDTPPNIVLSPRGATVSGELQRRYGCEIATDNGAVVEASDTVMLAVRPFQIEDAIAGLNWRPEQCVISLCAGVPVAQIAQHVNGAAVVRALPVVAAQYGESATIIFPDNSVAEKLLSPTGPVIAMPSEEVFEPASVISAAYGWYQALIADTASWLASQGVPEDAGRLLAAQMMRAAATSARERTNEDLNSLVDELCLPGSITGHGLDKLREQHAFTPWRRAAESVVAKLTNND